MKKISILSVLLVLTIGTVFPAPFGLKMGMTIDEISEQCEEEPSFVKDDV